MERRLRAVRKTSRVMYERVSDAGCLLQSLGRVNLRTEHWVKTWRL